jgi:ubiquinone/menaquinone biosynthesis C-methylase UbiE
MSRSPTDFGPLARTYDELRPADELWHETIELLVRLGDLRGRCVLDVGCGTGRLAALLAERHACRVWGVDVSPAMLEVARERLPRGVGLKLAPAEDLPFRGGTFERATMTLVVHHLDRPLAFAELVRVLEPGGRLVFLTFDPASFEGYYLNRFFPSFLAIDSARFPPADVLGEELRQAGFAEVAVHPHDQQRTIGRGAALAKIRGRHISTFQLIGDEEYAAGLARAERQLPERVEYGYRWLIVTATTAGQARAA